MILSEKKNNEEALLEYVQNGGCILTEADIAEKCLGIKTKNLFIKFLSPQIDEIFNQNIICDIYKSCKVAKESNHLENQNGINTTFSIMIGKGKVIVLPSGFSSLMLKYSIKRKNFYSEFGNVETNERVAKISKGAITHLIRNAIENLYHHRNLPFINLWQFPNGEKNIFSFRVDTDFGSQQQLSKLYRLFKENDISATWFVETKSIENNSDVLRLYREFTNQEIALHCFRHRVFDSYEKNISNINSGKEVIKKISGESVGFAAPFGEWNEELNQALEDLDFKYSSEFSYAYDSFPIYPFSKNSLSKILQIPIHPLSFGRLKWGGYNEDAMLEYFLNIIEQKLSLHESIILYTHPGEERLNILKEIFTKINSLNIPILTFENINEWWTDRCSLKWAAKMIDGNLKIESNQKENDYWVRVYYPNKEVYLSPIISTNLKNKKIDNSGLKVEFKIPHDEIRKTSARMLRHDLLFKYRKYKQ